jgi:hypothetical protein
MTKDTKNTHVSSGSSPSVSRRGVWLELVLSRVLLFDGLKDLVHLDSQQGTQSVTISTLTTSMSSPEEGIKRIGALILSPSNSSAKLHKSALPVLDQKGLTKGEG